MKNNMFELLARVDENHFAIVENDCTTLYAKDEFAPTPVRADVASASDDPCKFRPYKCMDFGSALRALKVGHKVARAGWNGHGMYLWIKPAEVIKKEWRNDPYLSECIEQNGGEEILVLGTICMYTHDSTGRNAVLTGWLASQSDMLCEDWYVVE